MTTVTSRALLGNYRDSLIYLWKYELVFDMIKDHWVRVFLISFSLLDLNHFDAHVFALSMKHYVQATSTKDSKFLNHEKH